jgi:hypothetical protein
MNQPMPLPGRYTTTIPYITNNEFFQIVRGPSAIIYYTDDNGTRRVGTHSISRPHAIIPPTHRIQFYEEYKHLEHIVNYIEEWNIYGKCVCCKHPLTIPTTYLDNNIRRSNTCPNCWELYSEVTWLDNLMEDDDEWST